MDSIKAAIGNVQHGLFLAILALMLGMLWAAYLATHHEQLHGAFEAREKQIQQSKMTHLMEDMSMDSLNSVDDMPAGNPLDHSQQSAAHSHGGGNGGDARADHQHSHSGSLANDAMQRLLRGHIHWMGLGTLSAILLLIVAFTSLLPCLKKTLGWTFGLGALAYPPAWIIMGFNTVELGPEAAEASIMWLFGPAVSLLMASVAALLAVLFIQLMQWNEKRFFQCLFVTNRVL